MSSRAPEIYDLDPAARELLQLDTFRNRFVVNEFVQGLSAANIASTARQSRDALDPKPYIRTFESALTRLQTLKDQVVNEGTNVDKDVKQAEVQFARKNSQLEGTFREINSTFTGLQTRISEVGKTAITIGIVINILIQVFSDIRGRCPARSGRKTATPRHRRKGFIHLLSRLCKR